MSHPPRNTTDTQTPRPDTLSGLPGVSEPAEPDPSTVEPPSIEGYRLLGLISDRGGQAVIWRAVQLSTGRTVALKMLKVPVIGSGPACGRFRREVELTASLDHPNIARIYESGLHHGHHWYAMELVDGVHLDTFVHDRQLDDRQVLQLVATVARVVDDAHRHGIIHRDLKPSNVMVNHDGTPRVLDFGLAKLLDDDPDRLQVSIDGQLTGTPAYMSPEQAAGRLNLDVRTDVYSLGVILYELLLGQHPHGLEGTRLALLQRIRTGKPRRPRHLRPGLDPRVEALLLKAMARKPQDRHTSAAALAEDIEACLTRPGLRTRLGGFMRRTVRSRRAMALPTVLLGVAMLTLVGMQRDPRGQLARPLATADAPAMQTWPFDAEQARHGQAAWASWLNMPVQRKLDLCLGVDLEVTLVPPGEFAMGSPPDENGRHEDEGPLRRVVIAKPFYMGTTEVTRRQFRRFVEDTGYRTTAETEGWAFVRDGPQWRLVFGASWRKPGFSQTDDHPVVCISYNDARAFCRWLSGRTDCDVDLPTEARWEYACRAGTPTAWQWGDDPDDGLQWCNGSGPASAGGHGREGSFAWHDDHPFTAPVGTCRGNAWGLVDMHGNVWEWCADWYARTYTSEPTTDPIGPSDGTDRVLQGGSWAGRADLTRSASRHHYSPATRFSNWGFRIVVDPDTTVANNR